MTEKFELYKCSVCGNLVQILLAGAGGLVCCGQSMEQVKAKNSQSDEMLNEKHTPVIENSDGIRTVHIGEHPMIPEHYIMFLECFSEDKNEAQIKYFYPNEEVVMKTNIQGGSLSAISYCNIHGLYESSKEE